MAQAPHFHQIVWDFVLHDHGILLRIFHWQFGKLWCLQHYWWNLEKKYLMRSLYFVDGQLAKLKCRPFLGLANPLFINTVFPRIVSAETILFWKLECGKYSREETIQGRKLFIIRRFWPRKLFNGGRKLHEKTWILIAVRFLLGWQREKGWKINESRVAKAIFSQNSM